MLGAWCSVWLRFSHINEGAGTSSLLKVRKRVREVVLT